MYIQFNLFHIQADQDTGWEINSQTIEYRMSHIDITDKI
jgi:hypothetical protein